MLYTPKILKNNKLSSKSAERKINITTEINEKEAREQQKQLMKLRDFLEINKINKSLNKL